MGLGFIEAARLTIEALKDGRFQHIERPAALGKNLLASGEVSPDDVIRLIRRCRSADYTTDPLHGDPSVEVHFFKSRDRGVRWYIKSYLLEEDDFSARFISVHESDYQ